MKLPKKINVLGKNIAISTVDLGPDIMGEFHANTLEIKINSRLNKKDILPTLYHEIGHAVLFVVGLDQDIPLIIQHVFIESFTNATIDTFNLTIKRK